MPFPDNRTTVLKVFSGWLALIFTANLQAAALTDHKSITDAAERHVLGLLEQRDDARIQVEAAAPDKRLQLASCPRLHTELPGKQRIDSAVTVKVWCQQPQWQLYVPVRVDIQVPMLLSSRALASNSVLSASDVHLGWQSQQRLSGRSFDKLEQLLGARLKRGVQPNQPILADNLCLVCRGDKISLTARHGGLAITALGTALQDGTLGDVIRVRNDDSGRTVEAKVTAPGQLVVNF
ncbi:flagellar basal body P-ring formation chaperone FlgA [Gallaecimonas sp. GXIMD4217]|uniref:flagellar basal body P-ring formation chaperone FlgA n=1 Tax=Gallaecimonas sp. GXIMD4217 TaxID=3131927 RepID=UPI00311B055C